MLTKHIDNTMLKEINDANLIEIIAETGNIICDCDTEPEKGFVRGIFIEQFEPNCLALPPPIPFSTSKEYERWTKYLDKDIQREIFDEFDANFVEPIKTAIQTEKNLPKPTSYCMSGR